MRVLLIILCIAIVSIGLYIRFNWDKVHMNAVCKMYTEMLSDSYEDVVLDKYEDPDHGLKEKVLIQDKEISVFLDKSGFYNFVESGDSIVKDKGSSTIDIYRDSILVSSFIIDFGCENMSNEFQ